MMEQYLDVRELRPPEPLERILDALADLAEDDWLRVTLRREPHPLYGLLRGMNYRWRTACQGKGRYEVLIWPADRGPRPPGQAG